MKHPISVVLSYCTLDYRFLAKAIEGVSKVASQIIVPVCDHFFNGQPEDQELLCLSYQDHPNVHFVEFSYEGDAPYGIHCPVKKGDEDWMHYWHSTSRYIGYHFAGVADEYVLFIDADEIFDPKRLKDWCDEGIYREYNALKFSSYFYFREARYRALSNHSNGPLLVKRSQVEIESLLDLCERKGIFCGMAGPKLDHVFGLDQKPLCDHYSWVKPREDLETKVTTWGHSQEQNWHDLLQEEFASDFRGKDSLFGLQYETVTPDWDPLAIDIELEKKRALHNSMFSNVTKVNRRDIQRLNIDLIFSDKVFES